MYDKEVVETIHWLKIIKWWEILPESYRILKPFYQIWMIMDVMYQYLIKMRNADYSGRC